MTELLREMGVVGAGISIVMGVVVGLIVHVAFWGVIRRVAGRTSTVFDDALGKYCRGPSRIIFPVLVIHFLMPAITEMIPAPVVSLVGQTVTIALILGVAWLLIRGGSVMEDVLLQQFRLDVEDNLRARAIHTQVRIIKRIIAVVVVVLALGALLMSYDRVREVGAGLLASAGLAGLVLGLAAQKALANLLAGIQIAFTQPMRIDDVVIVEGEWGWIEEITLTYVVVRIWDLRRLILPISYFLERPFQNWTRTSADILGTVYLHMDYGVPLDEIRDELKRIVESSENWDGKVQSVVVTGASDRTMEVRALVSSADSGKNWNLRCEVREKLIRFLQSRYPESLPRVRAEITGLTPPPAVSRPFERAPSS